MIYVSELFPFFCYMKILFHTNFSRRHMRSFRQSWSTFKLLLMLMFLEQKFTPQASFRTYIRSFLPKKSEINLSN